MIDGGGGLNTADFSSLSTTSGIYSSSHPITFNMMTGQVEIYSLSSNQQWHGFQIVYKNGDTIYGTGDNDHSVPEEFMHIVG